MAICKSRDCCQLFFSPTLKTKTYFYPWKAKNNAQVQSKFIHIAPKLVSVFGGQFLG